MSSTEFLLAATGLVKSFSGTVVLNRVDFQLLAGETHSLRLFGAKGGIEVSIRGKPISLTSPRDAIRCGVGYVPSERARTLFANLSVRDNVILPHLDRFASFGRFKAEAADRVVSNLIEVLDIRPKRLDLPAGSLSGGNQQKVIFARWVVSSFHTLLLDEPTHGIDVAAKAHILRHLNEFVAAGHAVLLASTEFHELLLLSDEIVTIRDGKLGPTLSAIPSNSVNFGSARSWGVDQ